NFVGVPADDVGGAVGGAAVEDEILVDLVALGEDGPEGLVEEARLVVAGGDDGEGGGHALVVALRRVNPGRLGGGVRLAVIVVVVVTFGVALGCGGGGGFVLEDAQVGELHRPRPAGDAADDGQR